MKLNLQFFGEEEVTESVETTETAELSEVEETVETGETATEEVAEEPVVDRNAIFAEARRVMEAKAKEEKAREDAEFVRRFGNYTNPETGAPIRSKADYLEALDAQQRMQQRQELESKGINVDMINQLIADSPVVKQANEMIANNKRIETMNMINADVAELSKLNPNIKSIADVPVDVVEKCRQIPGLRLPDAYKMLNYGVISTEKADSIRQATLNQVNSKAHLKPVNGVSVDDGMVDIPSESIATWKKFYPELSDAELRKKYNSVI